MKEGWTEASEYIQLFDADDRDAMAKAYDLHQRLPGYQLLGLISWDSFLLEDNQGGHFQIPTVPLDKEYLAPYNEEVDPDQLKPDPEYTGKIKWYIKPVVFGGDPEIAENINWICIEQHQELVRWWNDKYLELKYREKDEES